MDQPPNALKISLSKFFVDRGLPVSLAAQLRGQIEYGIAFGDFPFGAQLPSVRELSDYLGIAPATVSQVYKTLQDKGVLEAQAGRGTFVRATSTAASRSETRMLALYDLLNKLADTARDLGVSGPELAQMLSLRLGQQGERSLRLLLVGVFERVTESYVREVRRYLPVGDAVSTTTLDALAQDPAACAEAQTYDVILTFAYRLNEVRDLVGSGPHYLPLHFIPSEQTRLALAELGTLERVGLVSTFPDFLLTLKREVTTWAPHVEVSQATVLGHDAAELDALVRTCSVIVYASGADAVRATLPRDKRAFEYRFTPNHRAFVQEVLPVLDTLRYPRSEPEPSKSP